jgi:iron complex outermembrane receptor protein
VVSFTEYLDDYDAGGQKSIVHSQTPIAFSPDLVGAGSLVWEPVKGLRLTSFHKYVGMQYLDNTGSTQRSLSDFYTTDLRIGYTRSTRWIPEVALHATVYNLLNRRYAPNGYTYGYWSGGQRVSENFVYPQAGSHVLAGITLTFR